MRHLHKGRKLKRTSSHRKALLKNMASSLFEHKRISTTVAKAKELRPYAESLITKAKHALANEKAGTLPEGQTIDIHNRRIVGKHIEVKAILQELFDTIAPMVADRPGGYTRITKTGFRRGDAGQTAVIELVDWSAPQDGATSKKGKKKAAPKKKTATAEVEAKPKKSKKTTDVVEEAAPVAVVTEAPVVVETPVVEEAPVVAEVVAEPVIEETPVVVEPVVETPVADVVAEPVIEEAPVVETPVVEIPAEEPTAEEAKPDGEVEKA
jgi:large subunit ribosomal protein L17